MPPQTDLPGSFQLPEGWTWRRLRDLSLGPAEYGSGAAALRFDPDLPRYVRVTDIQDDGTLDPSAAASITRDDATGYELATGDLLLARSGSVGKSYLYNPADGACAFAGYVVRFRLDERACAPSYVAHFLRSRLFWRWVSRTLRQGAQPNINAREYEDLQVPCPSIEEQCRIATVLDAMGAPIQAGRGSLAKLADVRDGIVEDLIAGRQVDDGVRVPTWAGAVPAAWTLRPLSELLVRNDSGVWGDEPEGEGDVVVLRSTEVTVDGRWDLSAPALRSLSAAERQTYAVEPGDIVVTKSSGSIHHLGKSAIVSDEIAATGACFSNFMQRLRTSPELLPEFLTILLNSRPGRRQLVYLGTSTTGLANLNAVALGSLTFAVPPVPYQERAVADVAVIDVLMEKERQALTKAEMVASGVSDDLFRGAVRVPEL